MNTDDLKREIDGVIKHITMNNMLLWFINNQEVIKIFQKTFTKDAAGYLKKDGSGKELPLYAAFDYCSNNKQFNLMYLKKVLMVEINWIFENLPYKYKQSYSAAYGEDPKTSRKTFSKDFEFFRHIRDACAHGNVFNLRDHKATRYLFDKTKNPYYEASWNGFNIDLTLHGSSLFFEFMFGGDAVGEINCSDYET